MTYRVIGLAAGLWLAALCVCGAQDRPAAAPSGTERTLPDEQKERALVEAHYARQQQVERKAAERRMYEDIEVMRRLLEAGLRRVTSATVGQGHGLTALTDKGIVYLDYDGDGRPDIYVNNNKQLVSSFQAAIPGHPGLAATEGVEGTYLKGHGVVFSMTVPVLWRQAAPAPAAPPRKPLSDWERVRRELRGEKVEAEAKAPPRHEDTVADVFVKLLAENGHNFSQLPENEQVTVALTLRRAQACEQCHGVPSGQGATGVLMMPGSSGKGPGNSRTSGNPTLLGGLKRLQEGGGTSAGNSGTSTSVGEAAVKALGGADKTALGLATEVELIYLHEQQLALEGKAHDQALLGDLHMKQGRHKDAVAAYQKAVEAYQKVFNRRGKGPADRPVLREYLTALELYTKLAQGALAADDADGAAKAYQKIGEYYRHLEAAAQRTRQAEAGGHGPAPAGMELPAKLILSAPKKLLDQVGTGKISLEEFKKAVGVQSLTFPGAKGDSPPANQPRGY